MLNKITNYDLIITNRFIGKNSLSNWPLYRKLLTYLRFILVSFLLNIPFDTSGAYRCYKRKNVKLNDILSAKDNGYSFFWESGYIFYKKKYKIKEIPIKLPYRSIGSSKMKFKDIFFAFCYLIIYSFKKI